LLHLAPRTHPGIAFITRFGIERDGAIHRREEARCDRVGLWRPAGVPGLTI
jgi:hypothetical protein